MPSDLRHLVPLNSPPSHLRRMVELGWNAERRYDEVDDAAGPGKARITFKFNRKPIFKFLSGKVLDVWVKERLANASCREGHREALWWNLCTKGTAIIVDWIMASDSLDQWYVLSMPFLLPIWCAHVWINHACTKDILADLSWIRYDKAPVQSNTVAIGDSNGRSGC